MDCADIKVEMSEEGLLDPLVIVEEGDETPGVASEGSPAVEEDLGGGGEAAVGEEVAGQKEKPEEPGSLSGGQNGGGEGEEEEKTAAGDVNTGGSEAVRLERSESCERQPEGTKSQEEDPNKVSGKFLFFCGTEKRAFFFCATPKPQHRSLNDSARGSVFVCGVLQVGQPAFATYFPQKKERTMYSEEKNNTNNQQQ